MIQTVAIVEFFKVLFMNLTVTTAINNPTTIRNLLITRDLTTNNIKNSPLNPSNKPEVKLYLFI